MLVPNDIKDAVMSDVLNKMCQSIKETNGAYPKLLAEADSILRSLYNGEDHDSDAFIRCSSIMMVLAIRLEINKQLKRAEELN